MVAGVVVNSCAAPAQSAVNAETKSAAATGVCAPGAFVILEAGKVAGVDWVEREGANGH